MEKKKIRSRKIVKYGMAFLIPIICIVIHMMMTDCYPFGKNTILLGDSNTQYYAFFVELSGRIRQGKSIFFSWDMGLGYDFYTNFFYYLASPVNLIAVLFGGSHMELGMIVSMCIQVGLCGVTMTYFLSHTSRNKMQHGWLNDILCVVMGMAYSMCDYMLAYQYNLIWLICLLLVPVMMLGVERLIEGGDVALDEVFKAVNKAAELLESDNQPRAILFETALHGELLNLDEEDNKRHYAGGMSANRINAGLGMIISQLLEKVGKEKVAGLYTTGGDTMVNVCYQLGVECIEVMDYVIPQTDVGRLVGSKYSGLPVVGKGGLTGNDNTACDIVSRLFRESAR